MEKYFARMMGRDGIVRRWSVMDDTFSGTATELKMTGNGIVIRENNDEAAFTPIRSWEGMVTIFDEGNTAGLIAKSGHQLRTEIRKEGGAVEWSGYLTPDIRTQNYPTDHTELEISIRGRLATADGYYLDRKGVQTFVTLGSLLQECLLKIGFTDSDEIWWPQTYAMPEGSDSGLRVLAMQISRARFLRQGEENETMEESNAQVYPESCRTVIGEIMKLFGYTLHERGGVLKAVSVGPMSDAEQMEVDYQICTVGDLATLSETTDYNTYTYVSGEINRVSRLEGTEQRTSYCQGVKGVKVQVEMNRDTAEALPGSEVTQFHYLGSYIRYVTKNNVRMRTLVFNDRAKNIETYVYYRQSTEASEPWFEGRVAQWMNPDGRFDNYTMETEIHSIRAGMFPARMARYNQTDFENGNLKNYDYVDGYCFNPHVTEGGGTSVSPRIDSSLRLLRMRSGKEMSYKGGTVLIDFNLMGRTSISADHKSPLDYGVKVYAEMKIGNKYWHGDVERWLDGPQKFEIPLENSGTKIFGIPASRVKDQKTIRMPFNGKKGYFARLWTGRMALELQGELEVTLYIDAVHLNISQDYMYLFLTDLSVTYCGPDEDELKENTGNQQSTRTLSKRTTQGFDADWLTIPLMMGSYSLDAGTALSTLTFDGKNVSELKKIADGSKKAPEEFLLGNLLHYYDRIVERREITVESGTITDAVNPVEIEHERWRQTAIAVNYGDGVEKVTVERGR